MKLKSFAAGAFVAGLLLLAAGFGIPALLTGKISSNIIGGAGMPTYSRLFFNEWGGIFPCLALTGVAMAICGLFNLLFSKTVQSGCSVKTSAIALGLSCVGGLGLGCFFDWFSIVAFHAMDQHPIEYPCSIAVGMASLGGFVALLWWYFKERKQNWSGKGIVLDVLMSILFLPAAFWWFSFFYGLIG